MDCFERFVIHLKRTVPLKHRVVVRRVDMKDDGSTSMSDSGLITVCIRKRDPRHRQLDTLVHEWGHAWEYDQIGNHGKGWGIGMAKAYEAWEQFRDEVEK